MRSNFLKQKTAEVGEFDNKDQKASDDKENKDSNANEGEGRKPTPSLKTEKDYHGDQIMEVQKNEE